MKELGLGMWSFIYFRQAFSTKKHNCNPILENFVYIKKSGSDWKFCSLTFLHLMLLLQVEVQVRKLYCVNRAIPNLPISVEDASRSEVEIEKALQVLMSCVFV